MITIDKTDSLYKYLSALKVQNINELYTELASNGRYKRADVQAYFKAPFQPSLTKDLDELELEKVLDYYIDLKKLKQPTATELNTMLKEYKQGKNSVRGTIINSKLKDVLMLCLNYKNMHADVDVQDLVQVANLGLIQAIDNYDVTKKINLNDYINYCLWQQVQNEFETKGKGE